MSNRSEIMRAVGARPWAIQPQKLDAVLAFLSSGAAVTRPEVAARIGIRRPAPRRLSRAVGVAVVPIFGIITQHASPADEFWGMIGTSTEEIGAALDAAMSDSDVGTVVLDVDSPGGTVYGVPELAARIYGARGQGKRIVAQANSLMASAAFWLASAADEIVASPSAEVGSVGVYSAHIDLTGAQEQAGMKVEIFSSEEYKAEGALGQALTDEARAAEQARVDEMGAMFRADVARGRGLTVADVRSRFGRGRVFGAKEAKARGMVDRVATLTETVGRYRVRAGARGGANADTLRRRLALETGQAAPHTGATADTLRRTLVLDTAKVGR